MSYYVIVRGPLGCGKTTLARRLARVIGGRYLSVDTVLKQHGLTRDWEGGYIAQRSFLRANALLAPAAAKLLSKGTPIVVDGNFYWASALRGLERQLPFPHVIFTLRAPLDVCIEREQQRGHTHGEDAVRAVYRKALQVKRGKRIDATQPAEACVRQMLAHLRKRALLQESI